MLFDFLPRFDKITVGFSLTKKGENHEENTVIVRLRCIVGWLCRVYRR